MEIFTAPSLAVHGTLAYLAGMIWRRVVSGILTLIAVQYAAVGAGSICTSDHSHSTADAPTHTDHEGTSSSAPTVPCAPDAQPPSHQHAAAGCLAMAGCSATGVAAVAYSELSAAPFTSLPPIRTISTPRSILTPPDTPPPIA